LPSKTFIAIVWTFDALSHRKAAHQHVEPQKNPRPQQGQLLLFFGLFVLSRVKKMRTDF
jgi:hypothetical protein